MFEKSVHKDPYENIYCVISGEKEFTIHPPTDLPWIPYKKYPTAIYNEVQPDLWVTKPLQDDLIPWIDIDPVNPDFKKLYSFFINIQVG